MRAAQFVFVLLWCAAFPLRADNFLIVPFFNLSNDPTLDWIGESLAEDIRDALASEGIIALSREDREEAFRRLSVRQGTLLTKATVIRLGEFLDADQVVYGNFRFSPPEAGAPKTRGTLKITGQVVNLRKATRGPEFNEMGALADFARLQNRLTWQTVTLLAPENAPPEQTFVARRPPVRVDAIESYTRGLLARVPDQRLKFLTQAVRLEPAFSRANFELARLHQERKSYKPAADLFAKVKADDARYREAQFYLGLARYRLGDFAGAEQAFRTVAEAVPLNEVWNNLAAAQSRIDSPDSLGNFRKALEGDPTDPDYHFNVGYALFRRGELDAAAAEFRAVLDRDPGDAEATTMLGRTLKKSPVREAAVRSEGLERLKESFNESAYLQLKAVLEKR